MLIHKRTSKEQVIIPLSSVVRAEAVPNGWRVLDTSGETTFVGDTDWEIAVKSFPLKTMPAVSDTFVLGVCHEDDGTVSLTRTSVIGWGIYADGEARPIAIDWQAVEGVHWAVQLPGGRVETNAGHDWPDAEAWLAEQQPKVD